MNKKTTIILIIFIVILSYCSFKFINRSFSNNVCDKIIGSDLRKACYAWINNDPKQCNAKDSVCLYMVNQEGKKITLPSPCEGNGERFIFEVEICKDSNYSCPPYYKPTSVIWVGGCYQIKAILKDDEKICEIITDKTEKAWCYYGVAQYRGTPELCNKIDYDNLFGTGLPTRIHDQCIFNSITKGIYEFCYRSTNNIGVYGNKYCNLTE